MVHISKVRWLFWLRWKMFLRSLSRKGGISRIISAVFLGLFILIIGGGAAFGSYAGYRWAPMPINGEILFLVMTALFVIWILLPLIAININEGVDLSKLVLFPLTRTELMLSMLISTLVDIPTLGLILLLGAVVVGWATSIPMALFALLAMVIFYIHLVAISQLVLALLQPLLQSRRFRDLMILLTVVFASSGYLCNLAVQGRSMEAIIQAVQDGLISPYLQWLPSGMVAGSVVQASQGNWGISFLWLGLLLAITIAILYLGVFLVQRALTVVSESESSAQTVRRRPANGVGEQARPGFWTRFFPQQLLMLMAKDVKYLWRDPQLKTLLIQSLLSTVFLVIVIAYPQMQRASISGFATWTMLWAPNIVLLTVFTLSYNVLGYERQSLTTLLLFPIKPLYILWSKNLLHFLICVIESAIVALIIAFAVQGWVLLLPTLIISVVGTAVMLAIGNYTSVFFPQFMPETRRMFSASQNISAQQGCLRALTSFAAMLVALVALVPVALGVILPFLSGNLWIWAITLPASLAYGVFVYVSITRLVAPRMLDKTPEILEVVARE